MKRLFLILIILFPLLSKAQNYQCLQSGVKHYFTNKGGYLRGIRIDSTKTFADSTIYYPYHTPRGNLLLSYVLDSNGGSWLGKRVVQLKEGTTFFDNLWNDTIIIKTQAHDGDKWIFYDDTSKLYYEAEQLNTDTMTILGSIDSIKRILITAHDPSGIVTTDIADSFQILLSKNHGFVQVFDLYCFPYHKPNTTYTAGDDYFTDIVLKSYSLNDLVFSLVDFINITLKNLYQWNVGDVYEHNSCNGLFEHATYSSTPAEYYTMDTVINKAITTDNVQFAVSGWLASYKYSMWSTSSGLYSINAYTKLLTFDTTLLIDTTLMPEEYNQNYLYRYLPNDTSFCIANTLYTLQRNALSGVNYTVHFESENSPSMYKAPIGLISSAEGHVSTSGYVMYAQNLLYYSINSGQCGNIIYPPLDLDVNDLSLKQIGVVLCPNPAGNEISISWDNTITNIIICNLLGQTIFSRTCNGKLVNVNIAELPVGMYYIRINNTEIRKFVKVSP